MVQALRSLVLASNATEIVVASVKNGSIYLLSALKAN